VKIFLSGPMTGTPFFNFPAFHAAASKLREQGHFVFNPAERDIEAYGADISKGNHAGSLRQAEDDHGFSRREAIGACLAFICYQADAIALLPGWCQSKGAMAELATAQAFGLKEIYL